MREVENARFGRLFASPFLGHMWADGPELNTQLRESSMQHARQFPGETLTNIGGWHSGTGVLEFCGSVAQRLMYHMREMIQQATLRLYAEFRRPPEQLRWTLSAWANINQRGDFNTLHTSRCDRVGGVLCRPWRI